MANFTQQQRPLAVQTPLGADALLLEKFTGTEAVSEPFQFDVDMFAPEPVTFSKLVGQPMTLRIDLPGGSKRYINGIVSRLVQRGRVHAPDKKTQLYRYRADLVPALWLLRRRVQSRIFQHLSVPDILHAVLKNDWQLDLNVRLTGTYQPRVRCVQYRESDLDFVSRLMEEEGIHYFFSHQ